MSARAFDFVPKNGSRSSSAPGRNARSSAPANWRSKPNAGRRSTANSQAAPRRMGGWSICARSRAPKMRARGMCAAACEARKLGLAVTAAPGIWLIDAGAEEALRDLRFAAISSRRCIARWGGSGARLDPAAMALHAEAPDRADRRAACRPGAPRRARRLGYADCRRHGRRTYHLRFDDLALTGDAPPGAIVELRRWRTIRGLRCTCARRAVRSVACRSGRGARRHLARPATYSLRSGVNGQRLWSGSAARNGRAETWLERQGLARRQGPRLVAAPGLIDTLRAQDLAEAVAAIADRTGLPVQLAAAGEAVRGFTANVVTLKLRALRDDRRWSRLPARPLAPGARCPSRQGRRRLAEGWRRHRSLGGGAQQGDRIMTKGNIHERQDSLGPDPRGRVCRALFIWGATQWTAAALGFQPELGAVLFLLLGRLSRLSAAGLLLVVVLPSMPMRRRVFLTRRGDCGVGRHRRDPHCDRHVRLARPRSHGAPRPMGRRAGQRPARLRRADMLGEDGVMLGALGAALSAA